MLSKVVPAAATGNSCRAVFSAGRIFHRGRRIFSVEIPAPFAHVSVNVVKSVSIRLEAADFHSFLAVIARTGFKNAVIKIVLLNVVRIMRIKICVRVDWNFR